METTAEIVWAMLFGAVGMGYFVYGKRQREVIPFFCGVALFVFPYFVPNIYVLVATGFAIMAIPYFTR